MISMQIRMEFVVHVCLCGLQIVMRYMIIKYDDVQNIGEHPLVGKPSRELKVQLTENLS